MEADAVNDHECPEDAIAKAVPYGIYDLVHNQGFVYVGTSSDTAAFAVDAIERWFERKDRPGFADERKLLILCDSGGSNSYRVRNWKRQLQQQLADRYGTVIPGLHPSRVCPLVKDPCHCMKVNLYQYRRMVE